MNILVTGGGGYSGRSICRSLAEQGQNVTALVRPGSSARTDGGHQLLEADLASPGFTHGLPENFDVIVHAAQSRRYREFPDGAADMVAVNVAATAELLEWGRTHGARAFLLFSTGSVYAPLERPRTESDPCRPDNMYEATKLSAEYLAEPYGGLFRVTVFRPFTIFGPGLGSGLVATLLHRVREGLPVFLAGETGHWFSPVHMRDLCAAVSSAISRTEEGPTAETFNLCGPRPLSLRDMVLALGRAVGRGPVFLPMDEPVRHITGDPAKLRGLYEPTLDFTDCARDTADKAQEGTA